MPSSYTPSLRLTLPQTGDLVGTWGTTVNNGITSLTEQAIAGSVGIAMTADTNYTLSNYNGVSDEARNMFINVGGGPHTTVTNVICPAASKLYIVTNSTTGGQAITFKTAAGTGVVIPNGSRYGVYCNGTNVVTAFTNTGGGGGGGGGGGAYTADTFSGNGTAVAFNLSAIPVATDAVQVYINGVYQEVATYSIVLHAGPPAYAEIVFSAAPPIGTSNIEVLIFTGLNAEYVPYDPPFTGSVPTNVEAKLAETVSVKDFGAVGDGVTDDYQAFQDAIDSLPVSGGAVLIPATTSNTWNISQTLNVRKKLHLIGQVSYGTGDQKGTQLVFPANVSGIVFNSYNTSLYTTVTPDPLLPGAYGSVMENIMLLGSGGSTAADGVVIRCKMECRNVSARGFYRYGFRIYADLGTGGSTEGDANQWKLDNCQAILNGDHGVYVNGDDANTGVAIKVFSQLNGGYGIYENSLIGNTYIGCDTVGNTSGSMWADRASASNTIIGLWEDDAGTLAQLGGVTTVIGGNGGNPSTTSSAFSMWRGIAKQAPYKYLNARGAEQVSGQLGADYTDTSMTVQAFGATSEGSDSAWKFQFDATEKAWFLQYAASAAFTPIAYINSSASLYTLKGFTGPVFRNGYAVRKSGNINTSKVRMLDSAAPTTGTWAVGDIVYNDTPTSGGYIGWVCTTAGTPGTWKTFGLVS